LHILIVDTVNVEMETMTSVILLAKSVELFFMPNN